MGRSQCARFDREQRGQFQQFSYSDTFNIFTNLMQPHHSRTPDSPRPSKHARNRFRVSNLLTSTGKKHLRNGFRVQTLLTSRLCLSNLLNSNLSASVRNFLTSNLGASVPNQLSSSLGVPEHWFVERDLTGLLRS